MKYCLIEHLNTEYKLPEDYVYVALTQEVIFILDQRKIDYITFEDFYTSGEVRGDTDAFMVEQLKWFDKFDELLKSVYPDAKKLNLNLASIYYYWLTYMIDNVILTCRIIRKFIDSTNPKKISFVSIKYKDDKLKQGPNILHYRGVESTYSRLIEPLCNDYGLSFERLFISDFYAADENEKPVLTIRAKNKFRLTYNLYNYLRQLKNILRILIISNLSFSSIKTRMLFLTLDNYVYEFSKTFIHKPVKYFVYQKGIIRQIIYFFLKKSLITKSIVNTNSIDTNYDNNKIFLNDIYEWVNNKCELDISKVINTRMDIFVNIICPQIIQLVPVYLEYYKKEKIDYIITSQIFTIEEHAIIAAASLTNNTKTIYISHGADAIEAKNRYFKLIRYFDYYFTQTKREAENENAIKNEFSKSSPIIHSVNYMSNSFHNL